MRSNDLKHEKGLARRHRRVRGKISGTPERPRLCVTRSNSNIYAQVIDDVSHTTICGVSTLGPEFKATGKKGGTVEGAAEIGTIIGKMAQEKRRHEGRFRPRRPTSIMGASRLSPTLLVKQVWYSRRG